MTAQVQNNFLERTRHAKKVMVLDLGFLGDTVHLLPALWMVRQAYPQAELHCAVAEHVVSLKDCLPWVDRATRRCAKISRWFPISEKKSLTC